MNDDELLTAMRDSLTGVRQSLADVHMDRPAAAITGRARARRWRRGLAGSGLVAVALGGGLSIALTGGAGQAGRSVHVSLEAWSVSTTANGHVELTVRELRDKALLERTLAEAGVPAIVNFGEFCAPVNVSDNLTGTTGSHFWGPPVSIPGDLFALTMNPAALPSGAELDIGVRSPRDAGRGGSFETEIVKVGAALSCHPIDLPVVRAAAPAGG